MRRRVVISAAVILLLALAFTSVALAATNKYSFNDVVIDDQKVEITASVKDNNKGKYTQCTYFSDDYLTFLGEYAEPVAAGATAEEVLAFCVEHFDERTS